MQCLVNNEQELGNTKVRPTVESQDGEEVILRADYYPYGVDKRAKKIDMARAARIFRSGQQLQVAPEAGPGEPRISFVLAQIRSSKVHDDRIAFSFAMPEHVADKTWNGQWQTITQRSFLFKPSANQVLQRHFHRQLRDGALCELLMSGERKPVQQIIKVRCPQGERFKENTYRRSSATSTPLKSRISTSRTHTTLPQAICFLWSRLGDSNMPCVSLCQLYRRQQDPVGGLKTIKQ